MKCPKCGNEMGEGKMYCELCGEEIHIVPDFEPEIDLKINNVLNDVADEIDPSRIDKREAIAEANNDNDTFDMSDIGSKLEHGMDIDHNLGGKQLKGTNGDVVVLPRKAFVQLMGVALAVIVILLAIVISTVYKNNSASYQMSQGDKLARRTKYNEAITYYLTAYRLDSTDKKVLFKMAECYESMGNVKKTIDTYLAIVEMDNSDEKAFARLVEIYSARFEYNELNELLLQYGSESIQLEYIDYIARVPGFSLEEGSYDDAMELELIPSTEGKIYYTLDGSEPGSDCELYTEPIALRKGDYIISAIFVNEFGVCSQISTRTYTITSTLPDDPVISLDDGEFTTPQTIEVTYGEGNVYYTNDGSEPNVYSMIYTAPISMPMGSSTYKFVVINKDGQESNVITRKYDLNVAVNISEQQALDICINRQIELGRILDSNGSVDGAFGRMMYKLMDLRNVAGKTVYFVLEYYQEGNQFKNVDTIFAIDAFDGSVYHAIETENGEFTLEVF